MSPPSHLSFRRPLLRAAAATSLALAALLGPASATYARHAVGDDGTFPAAGPTPTSGHRAEAAQATAATSGRGTARAGVITDPNPTNPLAGIPWGVYKGAGDQAWAPYLQATGQRKQLLAAIALRPKAKWFGKWISNDRIAQTVRSYIDNATGGDPNTLVQMSIFRVDPWESNACHALPTPAQQASYKTWITRFAAQVGDAHAAIIMQPDGPFAACAPGGSKLPSHLIRYGVRKFAALPNTSVYIDAGASDWDRADPQRALDLLIPAGIQYARGFELNSTHYAATEDEDAFGTAVVRALTAQGIKGKHFVVNTAENGKPFNGYSYQGPNFDNARVCQSLTDQQCVTLGIPPTTDVANPAWGLSPEVAAQAARYVDGYLWVGRPWLRNQADPFVLSRALQLVRTTPY